MTVDPTLDPFRPPDGRAGPFRIVEPRPDPDGSVGTTTAPFREVDAGTGETLGRDVGEQAATPGTRARRARAAAEGARPSLDETKAEARTRLVHLTMIVLVASLVAPLLAQVAPGRAYVIATESMEPTIPKGSLVLVQDGPVDVGDAAAYESAVGSVQVHRIVDRERHDGKVHFRFQGDANAADDSFLVPQGEVVGSVEATVPLAGYLWLLPSDHKMLVFAAFVALYLTVTAWDARHLLLQAKARWSTLLLVLMTLAPTAMGGFTVIPPESAATAQLDQTANLQMDPGTVGTSNVDTTNASADPSVPPPDLWRTVPMLGANDTVKQSWYDVTSVSTLSETLPTARSDMGAVWDPGNDVGYLLGGHDGNLLDDIVAYNPANDTTWVKGSLPTAQRVSGAVWDPSNGVAYVFGGVGPSGQRDEIVAYDPSNNTAWVKATLPSARDDLSAVWDPGNGLAYVFGGEKGTDELDEIVAFDPSNNTAWVKATLPSARKWTSAVWDPVASRAYVFGGWDAAEGCCGDVTDDVVAYQPSNNTAWVEASLPSARRIVAAVWDSTNDVAQVLGGYDGGNRLDEIVAFEPDNATAWVEGTLPSARYGTGLWDPKHEVAYLLGGFDGSTLDEVVEWNPSIYKGYPRARTQIDLAELDPDPTAWLEIYAKAPSTGSVSARLDSDVDSVTLTASEVTQTSSSWGLVRSSSFTFDATREWDLQIRSSASDAEIHQANIVLKQSGPVDTVTQIQLTSEETTTDGTLAAPKGAARWVYDASAWDSADFRFEAVADHNTGLTTGEIVLHDVTSGSTVSGSTLTWQDESGRKRSGTLSLTDGHVYEVRHKCGVCGTGARLETWIARLVVEQDRFDRTVAYRDLTGLASTTSTTFVEKGYHTRLDASDLWTSADVRFEARVKMSDADTDLSGESESATVRLLDDQDDSVVSSLATSAVAEGGSTTERLRSGMLSWDETDGLADANRTYRVEVDAGVEDQTTAEVKAAWLFAEISLGASRDRVLDTEHHAGGDWTFHLEERASGSSLSRLDRALVGLRNGSGGSVTIGPTLPTAFDRATAVWDDARGIAYVLGGSDADGTVRDEIVAYDPDNRTAWTTGTLPAPVHLTTSAWDADDDVAYLFGGKDTNGNTVDDIVAFDPSNGTAWVAGSLPTARAGARAVWDPVNDVAHVFGGVNAAQTDSLDEIVAFDPSNGTAWKESTLPAARQSGAAVWDDGRDVAYYLGGFLKGVDAQDEIYAFDPSNGTAWQQSTLPSEVLRISAAWDADAGKAVVFGGNDANPSWNVVDAVFEYDPDTTTASKVAALPAPRQRTASVWDPDRGIGYVFGGHDGSDAFDDIVNYRPGATAAHAAGHLLSARSATSAVWDADNATAYVFGGTDGSTHHDDVQAFTPGNSTIQDVASLPSGRSDTSAVWSEAGVAYVFGGWDAGAGDHTDAILEYDPATDTVTTRTETLPSKRYATAAVWDPTDDVAYVFGGYNASDRTFTDEIVKFDPATGDVTTLSTTLPSTRRYASAVWDPTQEVAYVIGGRSGGGSVLDEVVEFDPDAATVQVVANLPEARQKGTAIWAGEHVYHLGGASGDGDRRSILRYDPDTDEVAALKISLPNDLTGSSAVWHGQAVFLFGGSNGAGAALDEIVRYRPPVAQAQLTTSVLPSPRERTSATWDPTNGVAYVFGGHDGSSKQDGIIAYDPGNGTAWVDGTLPSARQYVAATWDPVNDVAYVFGGDDGKHLDEIVAFDPSNGTAWVDGTLPSVRSQAAATWDPVNDVAYVFGGTAKGELDEIVAYDPSNGTAWVTGTLPSARTLARAVWDPVNAVAYVFGGYNSGSGSLDEIVAYDPSNGTAWVKDTLPGSRHLAGASWDATNDVAYVLGGYDGSEGRDEIVAYDPSNGTAWVKDTLPSARFRFSAVWDTSNGVVLAFGGWDGDSTLDVVVEYDPAAGTVGSTLQVTWTQRTLQVPDGSVLHHVVETDPGSAGTSTIEAWLVAEKVGAGVTIRQHVSYTLD